MTIRVNGKGIEVNNKTVANFLEEPNCGDSYDLKEYLVNHDGALLETVEELREEEKGLLNSIEELESEERGLDNTIRTLETEIDDLEVKRDELEGEY